MKGMGVVEYREKMASKIREGICDRRCRLDGGRCIILQRFRESGQEDILMSDEYGWGCLMLGRFDELGKPK